LASLQAGRAFKPLECLGSRFSRHSESSVNLPALLWNFAPGSFRGPHSLEATVANVKKRPVRVVFTLTTGVVVFLHHFPDVWSPRRFSLVVRLGTASLSRCEPISLVLFLRDQLIRDSRNKQSRGVLRAAGSPKAVLIMLSQTGLGQVGSG
jgi:hypothetical protein